MIIESLAPNVDTLIKKYRTVSGFRCQFDLPESLLNVSSRWRS